MKASTKAGEGRRIPPEPPPARQVAARPTRAWEEVSSLALPSVDERALAERLITYDTSTVDGIRAASGFVKGWLEARDITVTDHLFNGLPVLTAETGATGPEAPTLVLHGHLD